jgi:hypothetical protein
MKVGWLSWVSQRIWPLAFRRVRVRGVVVWR